ncbi:glycerol-3-phosphate responsive antiterminator [Paenibacillus taichungensis]|uniref:Glycerol uptake operon antiterminator regulatory protein n=1 Tax=Paenibacillus taichungensis TaxID=484184 RepID=A0ABX2MNH2_9BACL|nr:MULTISPECIES: glycerol-3-phosphate responsive antiterminator [Paenibacillus]MEC0111423.1 glycerol-3-phosphate responsive antiterminator [Paenibacillus taichungensis]MEC0198983.1 glycerol-3-phosphate responsive antiterminator [Paenibacillus taichungensis]NUU55609.1 glycerol-3-phosphate responsive antiterminator [Paenibacillus taichungensis]PIH58757.1 glycerol-3-phosphate responsive antiterminator GlpP [Paenibacillus sp. LK1]
MKNYPIIASITTDEQISQAIASDVQRVILMTGNITNLGSIIESLHQSGKKAYVHTEMVSGIGRDASAIQYLADVFKIDGIVTTKSNAVSAAKQAGILSIQRIFAIDTAAITTAVRMIMSYKPDEVELMPGLMPRVIQELKERISQPLIVGGLIRYEEEIQQALKSGADFVSVGHEKFWN